MIISLDVPVLHYGSKLGYASHFEAVSFECLDLPQHGGVHTPLFEACLLDVGYKTSVGLGEKGDCARSINHS